MNYSRAYLEELFSDALRIKQTGEADCRCLAISVFDHRLTKDEAHAIDDCSVAERTKRDQKLTDHWAQLFQLTSLYKIDTSGNFHPVADFGTYIQESIPKPTKTADQFQFVILPEYKAVYAENWDDTNLLWYKERELIDPILHAANEAGLHVLG